MLKAEEILTVDRKEQGGAQISGRADGQALMARPGMADVEVIRFTCPSWRAGG